jgi:hypothetical protein
MLRADLKSTVALYVFDSKASFPLKCDTVFYPGPGSHLRRDALVPEMPLTGKDHGKALGVGGIDDVLIAH